MLYGFLRTVFFIVVVYYLIRFISRVLVPYFTAVREMNERQKSQGNPDVSFKEKGRSKKEVDGEYVDYKEVK